MCTRWFKSPKTPEVAQNMSQHRVYHFLPDLKISIFQVWFRLLNYCWIIID